MTSVYISNENIQVVIGSKSGGRLRVQRVITGSIDDGCIINGIITDETALRSRITGLWKTHGLPRRGISLVVESSAVSTKILALPNVRSPYIMKLVRESFTEFDAEEPIYDFRVLGAAKDGGVSVLGCMTERSFVSGYIDIFAAAGVRLSSIDLALSGQIKLAKFCKELSERSYILAVLDKNTVSLFLFIDGEYRFSKRQRILYNRDTPELSDEIGRMISSLIQFKKSENISAEITDVFLCGFSDQEINSASLMFDGMKLGRLPGLSSIVPGDGIDADTLSDCVLALGNLL